MERKTNASVGRETSKKGRSKHPMRLVCMKKKKDIRNDPSKKKKKNYLERGRTGSLKRNSNLIENKSHATCKSKRVRK